MNFIKKFIGNSPTDEVAVIPSGKLFLTRSPNSPKGALECLYNDAFASIRQTTTPFYYQLCITRAYQEGELDNMGTNGFNDSDDDDDFEDDDGLHSITDGNIRSGSKDEWTFDITVELKVHMLDKEDGSRALCWKDLNGDLGDKFEFVIDEDVKMNEVDSFMLFLYKCLYEQRYQKSALGINSMDQLSEFKYNPKTELLTFDDLKSQLQFGAGNQSDAENANIYDYQSYESSEDEFYDAELGLDPISEVLLEYKEPIGKVRYKSTNFEVNYFEQLSGTFKLLTSSGDLQLRIVEVKDYNFVIDIRSPKDNIFLSAPITDTMSPNFNFNYFYFIFNSFIFRDEETLAISFLLKFSKSLEFRSFQEWFTRAMWETLNKSRWATVDESDHEYVLDSFNNLSLSDDELSKQELEESEEEEEEEEEVSDGELTDFLGGLQKEIEGSQRDDDNDADNDTDEDQVDYYKDSYKSWKVNQDKNSVLSVGYANNRTYVVRGDKLGVFSNNGDELNYQTTISNLQDLKGNTIRPEKMMLHQQDQNMIISDKQHSENKLYKMDLNRGKIVEEWEVNEQYPIVSYGPNSKFSQLSSEQTLTGISSKSIFQIDPRLSNSKFISNDAKKVYKKNNQFLTLSTTENGYLAVGSKRGDIRLYNKIGPDATSILPSLGDPIIGLDVSNSGRWILATCKSYLLLIDTLIGDGQTNSGHLGFDRYFNRDKKPTPRRLVLKTEHVAFMLNETNQQSLQFTTAHFNTGLTAKEDTIVTSTGPYIITWSLRKVLLGQPDQYKIKRYNQNIIADDFIFGSNQNVVLAMQDDVSLVKKRALKKPSLSLVKRR